MATLSTPAAEGLRHSALTNLLQDLSQLAAQQDAQIRSLASLLSATRAELAELHRAHSSLALTTAQGAQLSRGLDSLGQALTEHARAAVAIRESTPAPVINVSTPPRVVESTVLRDAAGRLLGATSIEKDLNP